MGLIPSRSTRTSPAYLSARSPIDSVWTAPEDDAANIAWTRDFWDRLAPYSHKGRLYLNFAGLGEGNEELVRRSFGDNFAQLGAIKRKYDPDNVFRFNQNIQPSD